MRVKIFLYISGWMIATISWGFGFAPNALGWERCSGTMTKTFIRKCHVPPGRPDECVVCPEKECTDTFKEGCEMITGGCISPDNCIPGGEDMNGCYALMQNAICGFDSKGNCDVIEQGYIFEKCSSGVSADCAASAPACDGGGCADGEYCRAKVSDPNQCTCAVAVAGCPGGYYASCRKTAYCQTPWGDAECESDEVSCRLCCVIEAPSAPTQIYPSNGAVLTSGQVNLQWTPPSDWGAVDCPNMNRTEGVWLGSSPTTMTYVYRQPAPYATRVEVVGQAPQNESGYTLPKETHLEALYVG